MTFSENDPTKRFSNRVEYYIKYRPRYPVEVLHFLKAELGLSPEHVIADIGSGTGFLSELLLQNGNVVWGVEPNREMREAAEKLLANYSNFQSIAGTAEATTLEDQSVDFITAGQSFHWFEPRQTKVEFKRILKPTGYVALIWNSRLTESTPFAIAYENMLKQHGTDYQKVDQKTVTSQDTGTLEQFFAPHGHQFKSFTNQQVFDYESLQGRLLSSSYAPLEGHPNYDAAMTELQRIFDEFQENGTVTFDYATMVYHGQIK